MASLFSHTILLRDGTGQAQRFAAALDPAYIPIDERSLTDWIDFTRSFAKSLHFFNADNTPSGTWENFLGDSRFISDLVSYINDPAGFANNPAKGHSLSRPHVALFISFLYLLGYTKTQLNGITRKHLDFYYHDILGLDKKRPVPDIVHVVFELADGLQGHFLQKGTALFAGKDSLGKDLIYKTELDVVITKATVPLIKTLYTGKNTLTLLQVHEYSKKPDHGFLDMWQQALGDPGNNYSLPVYKNTHSSYTVTAETLTIRLPDELDDEQNGAGALDYINGKLLLSKEEFRGIIQLYRTKADLFWQTLNYTLAKAYRRKILQQAREQAENPDTGLLDMFEMALGDPAPGSPLPPYKNGATDLFILFNDLEGNPFDQDAARKYINEKLFLTESSFKRSIKVCKLKTAGNADWIAVYADIETAQSKKRGNQVPEPVREIWENTVATKDAREKAASADKAHFNTFGKPESTGTSIPDEQSAATIGFAVSSPQLVLQEGERTVTLTVAFQKNNSFPGQYASPQSFRFFLSSSKGWLELKTGLRLSFGNFVMGEGEAYAAKLSNNTIQKIAGNDFTPSDIGKYFLSLNGQWYLIGRLINQQQVAVRPVGKVADFTEDIIHTASAVQMMQIIARRQVNNPFLSLFIKLDAADIYMNALRMSFTLSETEPAVTAPGPGGAFMSIQSSYPVLAIMLNQATGGEQANNYPVFKDLQLKEISVRAKVAKIKQLVLQNDDTLINYKKPFEPFGYKPETGSTLYFAHPELCGKPIDTMMPHFEWMNAPADFAGYYKDYNKIKNNDPNASSYINSNDDLKGKMALVDRGKTVELGNITLFTQSQDGNRIGFPEAAKALTPSYLHTSQQEPEEEAINWKRYFRLELSPYDFRHDQYPVLLTRQAFIKADDNSDPLLKALPPLNPPYTPKLKSFTIDYTASCEMTVGNTAAGFDDSIYHITPFGYKKLDITAKDKPVYFLPYLENEGELYLGIMDAVVPGQVSLFFKMAEGSANPDLGGAQVRWHYLSSNEWKELTGTRIVSDTTGGLLGTGILELVIPEDATRGDTLFGKNLHWLRAGILYNADAIPDTVDVLAQGISAAFADQNNADGHFRSLLAPESIQATVVEIPEIKKIRQPYASSKGKPAESGKQFDIRVSERLRHKGRALTMWDYEHLILEQFPDVYKVKCIPGNAPGSIDIIVIPSIKGKFPFNPFEPKVPAEGLSNIRQFIQRRMPVWAAVTVKNAVYVQVLARFAVKIKQGYNESFFMDKLQAELIRYMAPWAYDESADIFLNSQIDADMIINFVAERPYVDYVANLRLYRFSGNIQPDMTDPDGGENFIRAESPDVVLVSATRHQISRIGELAYENSFDGIGYMRVELDFKIGEDKKAFRRIGYAKVGLDFRVG